jgi:Domain of unknown function (DUF6458)
MKLGSSIALIALGAILSFAVKDAFDGINLEMIGYIVMGAGFLGLILTVAFTRPRKTETSTSVRSVRDPATGESITERRSEIDPR